MTETTTGTGVMRLAGGSRRLLWPEVTAQDCPVCGQATFLTRTMLDTPPRWFRFDDRGLGTEHACAGLRHRLAGLDLPTARITAIDGRSPASGEPAAVPARPPAASATSRPSRPTHASKPTGRPGRVRLQPLIDASRPGDRIRIPAGIHPEQIVLRHALTLVADDGEATIAPPRGPAIVLYGCGAELEGLTIRPEGGDAIDLMPAIGGAAMASAARPVLGLTRCTVQAPGRAIVVARPNASVRLIHTEITSDTGAGLFLDDDAAVRAEDSTIRTGGGRGITAGNRAILQLQGVRVERCGGDGIRVGRDSVLWANFDTPLWVRDNRGHGIVAGPGSTMTLLDSVITANHGWGVQAPGGTVTVTRVTNSANGRGALDPGGSPTLAGEWDVWRPAAGREGEAGALVRDVGRADDDSTTVADIAPAAGESIPDPMPVQLGIDETNGSQGRLDPETVEVPPVMLPQPEDRHAGVQTPPSSPAQAAVVLARSDAGRAVDGLETLRAIPGSGEIRLLDPRFRWVRRELTAGAAAQGSLIEALAWAANASSPLVGIADLVERVVDYASWLADLPIEDELRGIVAPLVEPEWVEPVLARLGWDGAPPRSGIEVSARFGVERRRLHQVIRRVESTVMAGRVWTPVLDTALDRLAAASPLRRDQAAGLASEFNDGRPFDPDGLMVAQRLFGSRTTIRLIEGDGGEAQVERPAVADDIAHVPQPVESTPNPPMEQREPDDAVVSIIPDAALGPGTPGGAAGEAEVSEADEPRDITGDLDRLVCAVPRVKVGMALWQLARDPELGYPRDQRSIHATALSHPVLALAANRPVWSARNMDPDVDLDATDRAILVAFRVNGPILGIADLADLTGIPGGSEAIARRLYATPFVLALRNRRYRLVTPDDLPSLPDVLRPDNETALADPGPILADAKPGAGEERSDGAAEAAAPVAGLVETPKPIKQVDPEEEPVLPRLVVDPTVGRRVDLPDPVTVPLYRLIDDLFAGRLRWPEETRRQRWSPARLPDLLDGIYAGLPVSPIVVRHRTVGPDEEGIGRRSVPVDEIVDGQQRLGLLARLFNPHYRVPGQPQTAPLYVGFRPDLARFVLTDTGSTADPLIVADIGPLLRAETTAWRVTAAWLEGVRVVRDVDDETAERIATGIAGIAAVRSAPITVQRVAGIRGPDEVTELYDRLHRS